MLHTLEGSELLFSFATQPIGPGGDAYLTLLVCGVGLESSGSWQAGKGDHEVQRGHQKGSDSSRAFGFGVVGHSRTYVEKERSRPCKMRRIPSLLMRREASPLHPLSAAAPVGWIERDRVALCPTRSRGGNFILVVMKTGADWALAARSGGQLV